MATVERVAAERPFPLNGSTLTSASEDDIVAIGSRRCTGEDVSILDWLYRPDDTDTLVVHS
ncbi:hypothetical protein ACFQH2_10320 [Natronoarchaeum sp. GCM10025703]|uniref:hypothetical protein n=1 Tax=Natronoarchaeum sp. GCM10025703 TaxID=3252685 RepID=UPI00360DD789